MNYICFSHNNFTTVQQSSRTPRDLWMGDRARNHVFALFGCKVLAELPESIMSRILTCQDLSKGFTCIPEFCQWEFGFLRESVLVQRWFINVL